MSPPPVIGVSAPVATPQARPQSAPDDPRSRDLAEALASLHDQARSLRTPAALASDLLAEALLQRRYGRSMPDASVTPSSIEGEGGPPTYAPEGRPGPLQVAPVPQATHLPSPSPGAPPPSAPAGTASAAPAAATSPAAGAAMAGAYGQAGPGQLSATPSPRLAPPPEVLNTARAAVRKGADPARVRARLVAHGYDPRAL